MKTLIKYTLLLSLPIIFIMSLKPCKIKYIKVIRSVEINISPNYNNHGLDKADSG